MAAPPRLLRVDLQRPVDLDAIPIPQPVFAPAQRAPDADRRTAEIEPRVAPLQPAVAKRIGDGRAGFELQFGRVDGPGTRAERNAHAQPRRGLSAAHEPARRA